MLSDSPISTILLATDLAASREFYRATLGLEILRENDEMVVFKAGGGTKLNVSKSTIGTADSQTQATWDVDDLQREVDELRSRGVTIEEYDMPGVKTVDGIADMGFAWAAWFVDPGRNVLGLRQLKR
jgi:catechol 2,3-dioxygenase-like lactoylglutathione lyase family enzyme